MPITKYKKHHIHYTIQGEGTPIVFLHGFGEDKRMWIDYLPAFSAQQVLTIDLPGFGQSDVIDGITIFKMALTVKAVLDQENIRECILIGHSMGGYVTLAFAKKYSHRLRGFGLFHSHPYADTEEKKASRTKAIDFVKQYGVPIYLKQLMPLLFAKSYIQSNRYLVDKMVFYGSQTKQAGIINGLTAMRDRVDHTAVLEQTNLPVLFIIGKKDIAIPLDNSLNQTHLPALSAIHLYENVGHMGMFESEKETIAAIQEFIELCQ